MIDVKQILCDWFYKHYKWSRGACPMHGGVEPIWQTFGRIHRKHL